MMSYTGYVITMVEDDEDYAQLICDRFELLGFQVDVVATSEEGFRLIVSQHPDLVILDLQLTRKLEGLSLLRELQAVSETADIPVIIHSIWANESEIRTHGINSGAWYCLDKDKSLAELEAMVKRVMAIRTHSELRTFTPRHAIDFDKRTGRVWLNGVLRQVKLSRHQALLLDLLTRRLGEICSRDEIALQVYDDAYTSDDQIDRMVSRLREKLGDIAGAVRFIETIHGVGYRARRE